MRVGLDGWPALLASCIELNWIELKNFIMGDHHNSVKAKWGGAT